MFFQAVATYDLRFLDIFAGWPGQSHDARVFRMNPLYQTLPGCLQHQQVNRLPETYHIVGDSAYPLSQQLMTPFRNVNNLNAVERKYNRNLSSKRQVRFDIGCAWKNEISQFVNDHYITDFVSWQKKRFFCNKMREHTTKWTDRS